MHHEPRIYNIQAGRPFLRCLQEGLCALATAHKVSLSQCVLILPYEGLIPSFSHLLQSQDTVPVVCSLQDVGTLLPLHLKSPFARASKAQCIGIITKLLQQAGFLAYPVASFEKAYQLAVLIHACLEDILEECLDIEEINLAPLKIEKASESFKGLQEEASSAPGSIVPAHPLGKLVQALLPLWESIVKNYGLLPAPYITQQHIQKLAAHPAVLQGKLVIMAGFTGSQRLIRSLMKTVLALPMGYVVISGIPAAGEAVYDEESPLFLFQTLAKNLKISLRAIPPWPYGKAASAPAVARSLWWTHTQGEALALTDVSVTNLYKHASKTARDEAHNLAAYIATMHLVEPYGSQTILVVTGSFRFACYLSDALEEKGIAHALSQGSSLGSTTWGKMWHYLMEAFETKWSRWTILALLKHPYSTLGIPQSLFSHMVHSIEKAYLRNEEGPFTLGGILARLKQKGSARIVRQVEKLVDILHPLEVLRDREVPFSIWYEAARNVLKALSSDHPFWNSNAPKGALESAFQGWLHTIEASTTLWDRLSFSSFRMLMEQTLQDAQVKPLKTDHGVRIVGTLEGQLMEGDITILAGLYKGVWPPPPHDPLGFTREEREAIGLSPLARYQALASHSFSQLFARPYVILSYAKQGANGEQGPSGFIERIQRDAAAAGKELKDIPLPLKHSPTFLGQEPIQTPVLTQGMLPSFLSVTRIEAWRRNPYSFYANAILKLPVLDTLLPTQKGRLWGSFVHNLLHYALSAQVLDREKPEHVLMAYAYQLLDLLKEVKEAESLWKPRIKPLITRFLALERMRRYTLGIKEILTEVKGLQTFTTPAGHTFTLMARMDRVEVDAAGCVHITDYKTGALPSLKDIKLGFSPQLPLEAALVMHGGIAAIGKRPVASLNLWHIPTLWRGEDPIIVLPEPGEAYGHEALQGLKLWIDAFSQHKIPFLWNPWSRTTNYHEAYRLLWKGYKKENIGIGDKALLPI